MTNYCRNKEISERVKNINHKLNWWKMYGDRQEYDKYRTAYENAIRRMNKLKR